MVILFLRWQGIFKIYIYIYQDRLFRNMYKHDWQNSTWFSNHLRISRRVPEFMSIPVRSSKCIDEKVLDAVQQRKFQPFDQLLQCSAEAFVAFIEDLSHQGNASNNKDSTVTVSSPRKKEHTWFQSKSLKCCTSSINYSWHSVFLLQLSSSKGEARRFFNLLSSLQENELLIVKPKPFEQCCGQIGSYHPIAQTCKQQITAFTVGSSYRMHYHALSPQMFEAGWWRKMEKENVSETINPIGKIETKKVSPARDTSRTQATVWCCFTRPTVLLARTRAKLFPSWSWWVVGPTIFTLQIAETVTRHW